VLFAVVMALFLQTAVSATPLHVVHGALLAETAASADRAAGAPLTSRALQQAVRSVAAEWRAAGADVDGIVVTLADLPGRQLGYADGRHIRIDADAAGWGWQRMSLASVLRHEMGHALGLHHDAHGLMGEVLQPGAHLSISRGDASRLGAEAVSGALLAPTEDAVAPADPPADPQTADVPPAAPTEPAPVAHGR